MASAVIVGWPAGGSLGQTSELHGKTVKQCTEELKANAAALSRAGESPAEFFHTCWWRSAPGHPTPIRDTLKNRVPQPKSEPVDGRASKTADAETAKAKAEIARAKREVAEAEADAAKSRKAMMIETTKAEAAAKAEKAARARAAAAEAAVKAQADAKARARAQAAAQATAQDRAKATERAEAEAKREAEARAAAEARQAAQAQAAAKARAAADAATKIRSEEAEKVAAAAKAFAAAKAQQAARVDAATRAARAAGAKVPPAASAEAQPRQATAAGPPAASPPARLGRRAGLVERRLFPRRPREFSFYRRIERRRGRIAARSPSDPAVPVAPKEPTASEAPVVFVPVHVTGLPAPIPIAVLPEVAPAFRKMVNHPAVPGFTSTP